MVGSLGLKIKVSMGKIPKEIKFHLGVFAIFLVCTAITKIYLNGGGVTRDEQFSKGMGDRFIAEKGLEKDVYRFPSGLIIKILKKGEGTESPALDTDCSFHYEGKFTDGKIFDSSYARGRPLVFAPSQVVAGWMQASQLMRVGDKWELYLPEYLAYGAAGAGGVVPPYSALIFTLEFISIENGKRVPTSVADETFLKYFKKTYAEM